MGYGDFWLLLSEHVKIQGRMSTLSEYNKAYTWFRSLAVECNDIRFQIEHDYASEYEGELEVLTYHNGKPFVVQPGTADLDLGPGMTVSYGLVTEKKGGYYLDVTLRCGTVKVDVAVRTWHSPAVKFIEFWPSADCRDETKYAEVSGLWGNCNGDPKDEFIPRGSNKPLMIADNPDAHQKQIYEDFAETWRVKPGESLFIDGEEGSSEDWSKPPDDFKPALEAPDPATFPQEVQDVCKESISCYVDYLGTGSLELGQESGQADQHVQEVNQQVNKPTQNKYCTALPAIKNGYYEPDATYFKVGQRVNINCAENYTLVGLSSMVCPLDQNWPKTPVAASYPDDLFNQGTEEADTIAIAPPDFLSGVIYDLYEKVYGFHPLEQPARPAPGH
jgi:hypothetical protein